MLVPLQLMLDRAARAKEDSDTSYFMDLLYLGETVLRLTVAAMVAAIQDDRERHQYRLIHRLVRADSIGDWSQVLDDALTGPASQHLANAAQTDRTQLTQRNDIGHWTFQSVNLLHETLRLFAPEVEPLPTKAALRSWYAEFPVLRNKTRGHGAPKAQICAVAAPMLKESIDLIISNLNLFKRQWAYLHRNLSGKYKVVSINDNSSEFDVFKKKDGSFLSVSDGIYIHFDISRKVDLIYSSVDIDDFFFPNGAFKGTSYELHSLITDSRRDGDGSRYLLPASERPISETSGRRELDLVRNVLTNLPPRPTDYIARPILEFELLRELRNDRHPIVTLVGRGGIGKTSLALTALHAISAENNFDFIFWFSARDIDLLSSGPKVVKPNILTEKDIAQEFVRLVVSNPTDVVKPVEYLAECLGSQKIGKSLFVFDNFETVRSPADLFSWIDMNIRLPNKALITSRLREFRADFPIQVGGMERSEADRLIQTTAERLGIADELNSSYRDALFEESDGHPYVIKIVLGEAADSRSFGKPERVIARKEEILDALFERTFVNLSPAALRVFLTLSSWRSLVPQLAVEAILANPDGDGMDVSRAINELTRVSLVESTLAPDGSEFLAVPLVAAIFGAKKLATSPMRASIEADVRMLQEVGPVRGRNVREGVGPRIHNLFARIAARLSDGKAKLPEVQSVLQLVSQSYPAGWLWMADLHDEYGEGDALPAVAHSLRRFLEASSDEEAAARTWERLARVYERMGDIPAAADAYVRAVEFRGVPFSSISNTANWLNNHRGDLTDIDRYELHDLFERVILVMSPRINEGTATDFSRLAWLYMPRDTDRAKQIAVEGLLKDASNPHCLKLVERLTATE